MADRCSKILATFGRRSGQLDRTAYSELITHYLKLFHLMSIGEAAFVMNDALTRNFSDNWERIYAEQKKTDKLKNAHLTWWEKPGRDRQVTGQYYLENWENKYAELADNWREIASRPENIEAVRTKIKRCIAGSAYFGDYEEALFITLEDQQEHYLRSSNLPDLSSTLEKRHNERKNLAHEITIFASSLAPFEGVSFLGSLSGAYVLSCPEIHVRQDPSFSELYDTYSSAGYSMEEIYIMVLLKSLWQYGAETFAVDELPLKVVEPWKYRIQLSK